MNNEIRKYLERMNRFNLWELKQITSTQENLKQFFSLMDFGYHFILKEQLKDYRQEKLNSSIFRRIQQKI